MGLGLKFSSGKSPPKLTGGSAWGWDSTDPRKGLDLPEPKVAPKA